MSNPLDFKNDIKPNWCPGCGHYGIQAAIGDAVAAEGLSPENLAIISGIGCSSRIGGYFYSYGAHTTHGRALPFAQGVKLANDNLQVICCSGDGDAYAIGMGHTIHAMRRNVNMTYIVMDNHVYGLTKGQTSPRSDKGFITKTSPNGSFESPLPICETAIASGATFIAQSSCVNRKELVELIRMGMNHDGFAFINVFSPCVTYNKQNDYNYFKDNLINLANLENYDPHNKVQAVATLNEYNGLITGLIYQNLHHKSFQTDLEEYYNLNIHDPLVNHVTKPSDEIFNKLCKQFK